MCECRVPEPRALSWRARRQRLPQVGRCQAVDGIVDPALVEHGVETAVGMEAPDMALRHAVVGHEDASDEDLAIPLSSDAVHGLVGPCSWMERPCRWSRPR